MDNASGGSPKRSFSLWRVTLVVVALGAICMLAMHSMADRYIEQAEQHNQESMKQWFHMTKAAPRGLDARFKDADQDLVADPPADAAERKSPEELVFSIVGGPAAEKESGDWKDFTDHLSRVTGKPVKLVVFATTGEQLVALEQGALHVTAFNTGAVPAAVATGGFTPVCTFGAEDGSFGIEMQMIVPAASELKKLEDVKDHCVTFTMRNSNSGYKAALTVLQDLDLIPQRDFAWKFSGGHEESIARIASGEYEVAPVASDVLKRMVATGEVKPEQFRVIYESERFPPATLGFAYNLTDELAANIRKAFLEFKSQGTSLQKRFEDSSTQKFVPLSYKQDYALVRRIDSSFQSTPTAANE